MRYEWGAGGALSDGGVAVAASIADQSVLFLGSGSGSSVRCLAHNVGKGRRARGGCRCAPHACWLCFSWPEVAFAPGLELDFVWIGPGTSLKGKRLQLLPWEFGVLLNRQREVRDQLAAGFFTYRMLRMLDQFLRSQWGNEVEVGPEPGDYRLVGRIVDASIQAKGSAFMLGPFIGLAQIQQVTWDHRAIQ